MQTLNMYPQDNHYVWMRNVSLHSLDISSIWFINFLIIAYNESYLYLTRSSWNQLAKFVYVIERKHYNF